jgi:hypothetical protein
MKAPHDREVPPLSPAAVMKLDPQEASITTLRFCALVLTMIVLIPAATHVFELSNKIGLTKDDYFLVQQLYRGWSLFGIAFVAALIVNAVLVVAARRRREPVALPLIATFCIAAGLAVFLVWTSPANVATANWTSQPADWQAWRDQWEYSHAADAALLFIAFCTLALSIARAPRS